MDNQTRNHLNLQKHIADQDHIIRVRNAEITALRKRAEKAEKERDEVGEMAASLRSQLAEALGRATQPRPLTPDAITDEMIERARKAWNWSAAIGNDLWRDVLAAALTPARPEGAEKVEAVLHQYWSGDINGDDLADRIVEEMNR